MRGIILVLQFLLKESKIPEKSFTSVITNYIVMVMYSTCIVLNWFINYYHSNFIRPFGWYVLKLIGELSWKN